MSSLRFIKNANRLHSESSPKTTNIVNVDAAAHIGIKTVPVTHKSNYLGGLGTPDGVNIVDVVPGTLVTSYKAGQKQTEPGGTKYLVGKGAPLNVTATQQGYTDMEIIIREALTGEVAYSRSEGGPVVFYPFNISSGVVVTATDADFNINVDGVNHLIETDGNMTAEANVNTTVKLDLFVSEIQAQTPGASGIKWEREGNYLKVTVTGADVVRIVGAATPFAYKLTAGNSNTPANNFIKVYKGVATVVDNSALTVKNYDGTATKTMADLAADLNTNSFGRSGIFSAEGDKLVVKSAGRIQVTAGDMSAFLGFTVDNSTNFDSNDQGVVERSYNVTEAEGDTATNVTLPDGSTVQQRYKQYTAQGGKAKGNGTQIL